MQYKASYKRGQHKFQVKLRPCAHESGSIRLRSQTGTDRPTAHTGSKLSARVWLHYPYQRDTDEKDGALWLQSILLPCETTDPIQKNVQEDRGGSKGG